MIRMRKKNKYDLQQIGNMDETPMNFDMPPSHTVNTVGEKSIGIKTTGNEKKSLYCRLSMSSWWHEAKAHDNLQKEDHA